MAMKKCARCGDVVEVSIMFETAGGMICSGCYIKPVQGEAPQGIKHDDGKPDWSLLPLSALEGAVRVLMLGAKKYARDNWRHVEPGRERYYSALMRHLTAWQNGEELDAESGERHLDHALCCLIFLRERTAA